MDDGGASASSPAKRFPTLEAELVLVGRPADWQGEELVSEQALAPGLELLKRTALWQPRL